MSFDRSLLPSAQCEFVVVADTHYMINPAGPVEFESRRKQGQRAGRAWEAIGQLDPDFVVHMGDMVQEFPGRPAYEQTMREALAQIESAGLWERCHFVVGNHDIGDRPDPTMPTGETTEDSLGGWQARFGPSWHSWQDQGLHFIVLNSQLFNTDMDEKDRQRDWFEAQLAEIGDEPIVLLLHMPPYLHDAAEPWLGHYDNLGEPDRSWLLSLVAQHRVIAMFTGHVHFQFFDHLPVQGGICRYFTSPSTSFTRPGFSHMFAGAAPPEQGRDDVPKTGFFLCRIVDGRLDVHRLRMDVLPAAGQTALVTSPSRPGSAPVAGFSLGATLRHPLALDTEVPVAWPSVIRQPVRNDYPLLACVEAAVSWVRVPVADLAEAAACRRLQVLRAEGIAVQAVALGEQEALDHSADLVGKADRLEVQLPGRRLPETDALRRLGDNPLPLVLCPVLPGQPVAGKQHHRTRFGYLPEELAPLLDVFAATGVSAAAACRLAAQPWTAVAELQAACASHPWDLQVLVESPGVDASANADTLAQVLVAAAALDAPVFVEPLVDMDRTMDVNHGLLDTLCNPRPVFELVRCLTALLQGATAAQLQVDQRAGCEIVALGERRWLVLPGSDASASGLQDLVAGTSLRVCHLLDGTVCDFDTAKLAGGPMWIYPASA